MMSEGEVEKMAETTTVDAPKEETGATPEADAAPAEAEATSPTPERVAEHLASCGTGLSGLVEDAVKTLFKSAADTKDIVVAPVQCEVVDGRQVEEVARKAEAVGKEVTKQVASCTDGFGGLVERVFDASPLRYQAPAPESVAAESPAEEAKPVPEPVQDEGGPDAEPTAVSPTPSDIEVKSILHLNGGTPIDDVPTLQSALTAKQSELDALQSLLVAKQAEIAGLHDTIEHKAAKLIPSAMTVKNARIDELSKQSEEDAKTFEAALAERDAALEAERTLTEAAVEEAKRLKVENDRLGAEMKKATEAWDAKLAAAVAASEKTAEEERTAKEAALAEMKALQAKMGEEKEAFHASLQAGCEEVATKGGELERAQERIAHLEGELHRATERIDAAGSPLKLLTLHFHEREARVQELEAALAATEAAKEDCPEESPSPTVEGPAAASPKDQVHDPAAPVAPLAKVEARDDADAVAISAE